MFMVGQTHRSCSDRGAAPVLTRLCCQQFPGAAAVVADSVTQVPLFLWSLLSCSGVGRVPRVAVLESWVGTGHGFGIVVVARGCSP